MAKARWRLDALCSLALTVALLGPLATGRGFALRGDMVFVPAQPWKAAWLGADGSVPRSVPMDALLSVVGVVVPGEVIQRVFGFGAVFLAAFGATRLTARHGPLARFAASVLIVWNPWVYERLAIGHWSFLVGYALLVWMVPALIRMRDDPRSAWPAVAGWLIAVGFTGPSMGLVAVLVAVVVAGWGGLRRVAGVMGIGLVANLPWLVPSLVVPGGVSPSQGQFAGFAARAESGAGLLPSLLGLGGIWKTAVVPPERTIPFIVVLAALLTAIALAGLRYQKVYDRRAMTAMVSVAMLSFALVALPAVVTIGDALDALAGEFPAVAMLRDSHRYLAPVVLLLVPGIAGAVDRMVGMATVGRGALRAVAVSLTLAPLFLLPSLAWGLNGKLKPVEYSDEWDQVSRIIASQQPATTVVLPWHGGYRGFPWNRYIAVLDPAPRYFPGEVLIDDRLYLSGRVIASEDRRLRQVGEHVDLNSIDEDGLRSLGVRLVLQHRDNGPLIKVDGDVLHDGAGMVLTDLGRPSAGAPATPPLGLLAAAWAAWVGVGIAAVGAALVRSRRMGRKRGDGADAGVYSPSRQIP